MINKVEYFFNMVDGLELVSSFKIGDKTVISFKSHNESDLFFVARCLDKRYFKDWKFAKLSLYVNDISVKPIYTITFENESYIQSFYENLKYHRYHKNFCKHYGYNFKFDLD